MALVHVVNLVAYLGLVSIEVLGKLKQMLPRKLQFYMLLPLFSKVIKVFILTINYIPALKTLKVVFIDFESVERRA
jgi:hypothetical protein